MGFFVVKFVNVVEFDKRTMRRRNTVRPSNSFGDYKTAAFGEDHWDNEGPGLEDFRVQQIRMFLCPFAHREVYEIQPRDWHLNAIC